jgi:hypothetical protein
MHNFDHSLLLKPLTQDSEGSAARDFAEVETPDKAELL